MPLKRILSIISHVDFQNLTNLLKTKKTAQIKKILSCYQGEFEGISPHHYKFVSTANQLFLKILIQNTALFFIKMLIHQLTKSYLKILQKFELSTDLSLLLHIYSLFITYL